MKKIRVRVFLFFLIPIYTLLCDEGPLHVIPPGLNTNIIGDGAFCDEDNLDVIPLDANGDTTRNLDIFLDEDIFRVAPPGYDIEITAPTYINGNLSVGGTILPVPGVGSSKTRTWFFPAQTLVNRMSASPDSKFTDTYSANNRPVPTWTMLPSASTQRYLSVLIGIPAAFDTTVNPTVDLFIAVSILGQAAGRTAKFQIDADYAASGDIIGVSSPATGLDQSVTTGDLAITEATGTNNLKIYKVSATLNGALVSPGGLCGLYFSRVAPITGTEYGANLFLVAVSFNFSVT